MTALKLVQPDPPPFKRPTREFISAYKRMYFEAFGEECLIPWGQMSGMICRAFEGVDHGTGEEIFDYPSQGAWEAQIAGFFDNDYAKSQRYPFGLFLKQFGQYANPKRVRVIETTKARCGAVVAKKELAAHERGCDKCFPPASPEVVREAVKAIEGLAEAWRMKP